MSDIIHELRQKHRNVTGGNPLIDPINGPTMFSQAADEIERQTEIIVTLRQELKEAKARNTMYLSKLQEYEAREQ